MSGARIVVLGGINMDLVVRVERFPRPGETIEALGIETTPGGKGANQAIAAARALDERGAVAMVGQVGDDVYGVELRAYLDAAGVETGGIGTTPGIASGLAIIGIDGTGENTVTAAYGANSLVAGEEVGRVVERLESASVLLVQQETPLEATLQAMEAARRAGVRVILDPAPARELPRGFLELATIVTPNQTEAEALAGRPVTGVESAAAAATAIRERFGVPTVIVTLGEAGAYVLAEDGGFASAPFPVSPVATVAAGDAFNGSLAAGLVEGRGLREAVRFASAAAAICVTREGAGASMPRRAEILAKLGER